MDRLSGKRAIVVGAGSIGEGIGNGRAIAMLFAREGAKVLAADKSAPAVQNTVDRILQEDGVAEPFTMDATKPNDAASLVEKAIDLWGGVDILVHVVGMSLRGGVSETTPEDWDKVFEINLKSAFLAAQAVLPVMKTQQQGALAFISSLVADYSGPYSYAAYESSKAGLNRLSRSIARAHAADGIRSNVVMPGMIDTPHVKAFISDTQGASSADRSAAVPMKRQGTPWDVAEATLFLVSDASSYITGTNLPVDGGLGI